MNDITIRYHVLLAGLRVKTLVFKLSDIALQFGRLPKRKILFSEPMRISKHWSLEFEALRDLTRKRLLRWWNGLNQFNCSIFGRTREIVGAIKECCRPFSIYIYKRNIYIRFSCSGVPANPQYIPSMLACSYIISDQHVESCVISLRNKRSIRHVVTSCWNDFSNNRKVILDYKICHFFQQWCIDN